jgi:hypothetical protein
MLTLFATCKAFRGHTGVIQRNAIQSWLALRPRREILLVGDEEGSHEICREFGIRQIGGVECVASGRPLLSSIFKLAEAASSNDWLCYINADIILCGDFAPAVRGIIEPGNPALVLGRRWEARVERPIDFSDPNWEFDLRRTLQPHRRPWRPIDFWIYHRDLLPPMPPFILGRNGGCDGWVVFTARSLNRRIIDASSVITAVHQSHDRPLPCSESVEKGEEVNNNLRLLGGPERILFIADATHVMTRRGLRPAIGPAYLWRRLYNLALFRPAARPLRLALDGMLAITRPVRRRTGWSV